MAHIQTAANETVFQIKRWLGVNEAQEGEASLKNGEAARMKNFRVTAGGALQKRPGSMNVAGLMAEYTVTAEEKSRVILTERGASTIEFTAYPRAAADSVGNPIGDGNAVALNYDTIEDYAGYFCDTEEGLMKLRSCAYTPASAVGASRNQRYSGSSGSCFCLAFDSRPAFSGGEWDLSGGVVVEIYGNGVTTAPYWKWHDFKFLIAAEGQNAPKVIFADSDNVPDISKFVPSLDSSGKYMLAKKMESESTASSWRANIEWQLFENDKFEWSFSKCVSEGNSSDAEVRGIWSGFVGENEVLCAACNGYLWQLHYTDGAWSKTACGAMSTSTDVHMFGFGKKLYVMNGSQFKVWDGTTMSDVSGYIPLVSVSTLPSGGGTQLEQVNKLSASRRARFSPDGAATVFQLPETDLASIDSVKVNGTEEYSVTKDTAVGTVTFSAAPAEGVNTVEIQWTAKADGSDGVKKMRFSELYNGAQDTRVFIYGDGSNQAFYSGLDSNGQPRADYFPDLNVVSIGESNTPITGMIRQYSALMAFKQDSAYSVSYDAVTLTNGTVTAGFYVRPVNRDIGNCAPGQVRLVENRPRTLDARSVIQWRATSTSGMLTNDQRNAEPISQRVDSTIKTFDLTSAKTYYDKFTHEYYVIGAEGTALVHNIDADAWYVYTDFDARCLVNYKDELYFGTNDGYIRHFSRDYCSDNGEKVECLWESGSMSFSRDYMRKYSAMLWVGVKPENNGYLKVTAETDKKSDFAEYAFEAPETGAVPTMRRIKLKAKKFTYYKLILENNTADKTATVVAADIRVRPTGYVR